MNIRTLTAKDRIIAVIDSDSPVLTDVQSGLDLIATLWHEVDGVNAIILPKAAIDEAFFELRTGIAGGILQKLINYRTKMAIVGDFSGYTSKALADFIRECNRGHDFFFVSTEEEAVSMLSAARG
ncbi:DUF4180 domain-containing protein [Eubacteriales bacterium OttesenSCG-928-A19]|nr:DUF4180 domain-containing protein [Eubacteriales bacterium OttesenSCG-928-A19]